MKISQIAAKIAVRLFFILFFISIIPVIQGDQSKLQHVYFTFHHKWEMIFPIILILAFITLTIYCTIKKYKEADMNWLLVLNTAILIIYGAMIYIKVFHMVG